MRIGIGYDVHRMVENRPLILGGVSIPYINGLDGHSDADVLVHAIMDSCLGAMALGDIGRHFPDTRNEFKNISSLILLKRVNDLIRSKGYEISNIDSVIVAQKPKLAQFIPSMVENIAKTCSISTNQVNVSATTEEHLGFTGRLEGISAKAVALLKPITL